MPTVMLLGVLFLNPWTAVATAAAAAAIPVIIHFLNRRRYRILPWAAMRFLISAQRRTIRKLRIEQLLLLAIRVSMVLLLIAAMVSALSWMDPLWNRLIPAGTATGAAPLGRIHRIIVVDGSFSMGRRHDDGTSFDRAKGMALRIIRDASPGDGYSLFLMSAPVQAIVPGPSDNAANVSHEVERLRLPHGNSDLTGSLAAIERILAQPLGKYHRREVYFLTDLQSATLQPAALRSKNIADESSTKSEESSPWLRIQSHARVVFVDVARDSADNTAVVHAALSDPLPLVGGLNSISAVIHNYGDVDRVQLRVSLFVEKGREAPGSEKAAQLVNVPAGASVPVVFPWQFVEAGDHVVQIRIDNDALDLDDVRSLIVTVRKNVPVLLVNGKPTVERDEQATHHLSTALNPRPTPSGSALSPFAVRILTEAQLSDVGLGDLDPYDCVVLCDVSRLSERKVERIETFLRRGGGVIFSLGSQVDMEAYNRLLYRNGEGLLPARLVGIAETRGDEWFSFASSEDAFQHPPLAAFVDDNDRAALLGARFRKYVKVQLPPRSTGRVLLSFVPFGSGSREAMPRNQSGLDAAVIEWPVHRGRVFLITTTVNLDWGSWPGSPAYLPFMHELMRHAAIGAPKRTVNAMEPLIEYFPARFGTDVMIVTPDDRTIAVAAEEHNEVNEVRFFENDIGGIYRLKISGDREHLFAVNVPTSTSRALPSESDLRRANPAELTTDDTAVQLVTDIDQIRSGGGPELESGSNDTAPRSTAGKNVARVLLFAFFALLVVEMILAWRFGSARAVATCELAHPAAARSYWRRLLSPVTLLQIPLVCLAVIVLVLLHETITGEFLGFLPDLTRQRIEAALEVPPSAPGEGTRWRLEYMAYLTGHASADRWLVAAILLSTAAAAIFIYRMERLASRIRVPGDLNRPRSLVGVASLRMGLVSLTLLILMPQIQLEFEREGWPDLVVMIDTSRSFGASDDFQESTVMTRAEDLAQQWAKLAEPQVQGAQNRIDELNKQRTDVSQAGRLASIDHDLAELRALIGELKSRSRLNLSKALVAGSESWFATLIDRRRVKVHVYRCDVKSEKLAAIVDQREVDEVVKSVRSLRASGERSELGSAVHAVLSDNRGGSLGAIIFLTDGVVTSGENLVQAARAASRAGVPLYLVGIGDAHEARDLIIHDLQVEELVNVRDRIIFEARVSRRGKLNVDSVPVILFEKNISGELNEITRETVVLDPAKPVNVRLTTTPAEVGEKTYVIQIPTHEDESDRNNNKLERRIQVTDAKPVRVLYIEGFPHHDYRFVKALLEREAASKHGNRSIAIRVLLADADKEFASQDKSALSEFPSRDELFAYDVVIVGDVDPKHAKLGDRNLQLLRDFVRERGGGMLFLAGIHGFMPNAYQDTPLADVLPVISDEPSESVSERSILESDLLQGYRPVQTPIGQQHPIFRFVADDAQNLEIWRQLPPMFFAASRYRPKPSAEVLATHPQLPARRNVARQDESGFHPLVVQQFVGAGRVMFFGFNETSRWRFREMEIRFNQFWIQAVRFLSRNRVGRIDLHLDRQTPYRRNDPIRVTVRFPDDAPPPDAEVPVKVMVERCRLRGAGEIESELLDTQLVPLTKVQGSRATYEALLTKTPEGEYKFWLAAPVGSGSKAHIFNRVLPPPGELDRLRLDQAVLELAAKESRGKFYTLADVDSLIDDLPPGTRVSLNQPRPPWHLWNHALVFLLAMGLLSSEWILRKSRRLL